MTRRALRWTPAVALVAAFALWLVFLRPSALGGSTDYVVVSGSSMRPTLRDGDLVVVRERDFYDIGDVIAFHAPPGLGPDELVIHRVVGGSSDDGYVTRGDNRSSDDAWRTSVDDIVGRRVARVPFVGAIAQTIAHPFFVGLVVGAALASILWVSRELARDRQRRSRSVDATAAEVRVEAVALRIHRKYEATTAPAERLRIRRLAFETAAALASEQPNFDTAEFLRACGTHAYDGTHERSALRPAHHQR